MTGNRRRAALVGGGMRRTPWIAAAVLLFASACARTGGAEPADPRSAFDARAELVAATWARAVTTPAWRDALIPLENLTVAPNAGLTESQQYALGMGRFTLSGALPGGTPPDAVLAGRPVSLVGARSAYAAMARSDTACPPGAETPAAPPPEPAGTGPDGSSGAPAVHDCTVLTVTGATLGTTALRTNRGAITVPAWLFTVAGLSEPVARVAVEPGELASPPDVPVPPAGTATPYTGAHRLTAIDGAELSFIIGIGACQTGAAGLVHETDDVVVIGGDPGRATAEVCPGSLLHQPVTATLRRPPAGRPVVDVLTGRLHPVNPSPF